MEGRQPSMASGYTPGLDDRGLPESTAEKQPQTPPPPAVSKELSCSDNLLNRPRHTSSSPFFGSYQNDPRPRTEPSPPSSKNSLFQPLSAVPGAAPSAPSLEFSSGPEFTPVPFPNLNTFSKTSTASLEESQASEGNATGTDLVTDFLPRSEKRVLRADDWWQKDKQSQLPEKSASRPQLPLAPASTAKSSPSLLVRRKVEVFDREAEALRAELTPSPLRIRKATFTCPVPAARKESPQRIVAAGNSQDVLKDSNLDLSPPRSRQSVVERIVASEHATELPESLLAASAFQVEEARRQKHRRRTLEILESSLRGLHKEDCEQEATSTRSEACYSDNESAIEMDSLRPESAAAMTAHRREAVRLAKSQETTVLEKCRRGNQEVPGYSFDELIGKGSFGRVYKGRQKSTSKIVAIKVLDIDDADFHAYGEQKDEQIRDFNREIRILRQAQDSGAENLNQMIEALPVHSQLWLICEYCPGGSVKTLMRATKDRLAEKYIKVVARELGKALKGLHEAGIMHRDVKAANVLIHEEGRLQLCDFGVATVLDTRTDKRRTFIGTLHWMPPELWTEKPEYSDEVDVWEYGCTLYECAVGRPPNSDLRERQQLKMRMRRLKQAITLPENEVYSDGLRSLVTFALSPDVTTRPSMKEVLLHDFLAHTEESHPTSILTELVQTYYAWVFSGGQRVSLFMPGGAAAAATEDPDAGIAASDEWNFSMTQDFEKRLSSVLEIPELSEFAALEDFEGDETPRGPRTAALSPPQELTAAQKANFEKRVQRGADLSNLFDQERPAYEYKTKTDFVPVPEQPEQRRTSDLTFRAMAEDRPMSIASNVIDLGDFDEADYAVAAPRTDDRIQTAYAGTAQKEETIRLADASTLRQKRADSKGPREPSSQSLTARRTSSAEDIPIQGADTNAPNLTPQQEQWTIVEKRGPELQEAAEITPNRPDRATMDWSFAKAMSSLPTDTTESQEEKTPAKGEPASVENKARKHATLEWSFSSAMAEASAADTLEIRTPQPRTTPSRPAPMLRQMTMPVTSHDFQEVEEDPPRPSTALSEAYSESSQSSADIDPFGLEVTEDGFPGPAALDEAGMPEYYAERGRTMTSSRPPSSYHTTTTSASGPAPYALGRPARLGEDGFPGSGHAHTNMSISSTNSSSHGNGAGSGSSAGGGGGGTSTSTRPIVEVPEATPPSMAALSGNASSEEVEEELMRMLEGMQGTLQAASTIVQARRRRGRGRAGRPSSSEWEDEE